MWYIKTIFFPDLGLFHKISRYKPRETPARIPATGGDHAAVMFHVDLDHVGSCVCRVHDDDRVHKDFSQEVLIVTYIQDTFGW